MQFRDLIVFEILLAAGMLMAIVFASPIDGTPASYATVTPILRGSLY